MMSTLAPFIMITATAWMITLIILSLIKYRIKKRMIETNLHDEQIVKAILESSGPKERQRNVLKWTLLGIFGGMGLILQEFLPYDMNESLLPYGFVILLLSIGLLVYYILVAYFLTDHDAISPE